MRWELGDGRQAEGRLDAMEGFVGIHMLSVALLIALHEKSIKKFAHISCRNDIINSQHKWKRAIEIGLVENLAIE